VVIEGVPGAGAAENLGTGLLKKSSIRLESLPMTRFLTWTQGKNGKRLLAESAVALGRTTGGSALAGKIRPLISPLTPRTTSVILQRATH